MYCHTNALFQCIEYAKDMNRSRYEVRGEDNSIQHFTKLINGNSENLNLRLVCINKFLGDVKNDSSKILNLLENRNL